MIELQYVVIKDRKDSDFFDYFPDGFNNYNMAIFHTSCILEQNGVPTEFPPYTAIINSPNQRIYRRANNEPLLFDWISFFCNEPYFTSDFIPFGIPFYCDDYWHILHYLETIAYENIAEYPSREFVLTQLMTIFLQRLHDITNKEVPNSYYHTFMKLRSQIYEFPSKSWTLSEMAAQLHISTRLLQKTYKNIFHVSCNNDVISSRITSAKNLLRDTNYTLNEISIRCGYNNVEHFCRQFKNRVNCTPNEYRLNHPSRKTPY